MTKNKDEVYGYVNFSYFSLTSHLSNIPNHWLNQEYMQNKILLAHVVSVKRGLIMKSIGLNI